MEPRTLDEAVERAFKRAKVDVDSIRQMVKAHILKLIGDSVTLTGRELELGHVCIVDNTRTPNLGHMMWPLMKDDRGEFLVRVCRELSGDSQKWSIISDRMLIVTLVPEPVGEKGDKAERHSFRLTSKDSPVYIPPREDDDDE
jgi:hypothetical protein